MSGVVVPSSSDNSNIESMDYAKMSCTCSKFDKACTERTCTIPMCPEVLSHTPDDWSTKGTLPDVPEGMATVGRELDARPVSGSGPNLPERSQNGRSTVGTSGGSPNAPEQPTSVGSILIKWNYIDHRKNLPEGLQ
jgi:hypothetical protein